MNKKKIIMLAAHEPTLDPRIGWEANVSAKHGFDTYVIGLQPWLEKLPYAEDKNGYKIIRVDREKLDSRIRFSINVFRNLASIRFKVLTIIVGIILSPLLIVLVALYSIVSTIRRLMMLIVREIFIKRVVSIRLKIILKAIYVRVRCGKYFNKFFNLLAYIRHFIDTAVVLWNKIDFEDKKPEIVHCNDLDTLVVGALAKRIYGCKLVYDAHEFWPYSDVSASWYHKSIFKKYEKWLINFADTVITVNPLLAKQIEKEYKIEGIYSLPNCEPWSEHNVQISTDMGELAGIRVKFLYQGNFAPGRGIEELILAWKQINKETAVLFLRGPNNPCREACIKLAHELGLLNRTVYFLDPVKEEELISAAMEADVGIIPYKPICINNKYACPNKLSQYMQAGLTIISNNLEYVKQILDKYECGIVYDSNDINTLVNSINYVIDNPNFRVNCGKNGRKYAESEYNWQMHSDVLIKAYNT